MLLTFIGLIFIQARYVKINAEMIEDQFNENVQRSLFQTVSLVEEKEALEYLSQIIGENDTHSRSVSSIGINPQNIETEKNNIDSFIKSPRVLEKSGLCKYFIQ